LIPGTHESLLQAGNFIETIEKRQGLKVACLEEIGYQMGYIDADHVMRAAQRLGKNRIRRVLEEPARTRLIHLSTTTIYPNNYATD
jgi:glucose-1-phosphate thymidylyltransferase